MQAAAVTTMSTALAGTALRRHSTTARASATRVVKVQAILKTKTKVRTWEAREGVGAGAQLCSMITLRGSPAASSAFVRGLREYGNDLRGQIGALVEARGYHWSAPRQCPPT